MEHSQALKKVQSIQNLPPLPTIALEVNRLLQDMETTVNQLVALIEKDQTLVMKLLKLVNSSFYGFKNKVNNLRHAVTLMGYNTIQNAVVALSVMEALNFENHLKNFRMDDFWKHAIRVAVMSRYLGARTRLVPVEEAFTAGLIHDIGKVVLLNYFPRELAAVLHEMQNAGESFCQAETRLAVCPHGLLGSYLAQRWLLPQSLVYAIYGHHDHLGMEGNVGDHAALIAVVELANNLVHMMDENVGYHLPTQQEDDKTTRLLMDVLRDDDQWWIDVKKEMEVACSFFDKG